MDTKTVGDVYLAAAMISYNVVLADIDRTDRRRQRFNFKNDREIDVFLLDDNTVLTQSVDLDKLEAMFTCNRLMLPPIYPDCVKKLKSALYAEE